MVTGGAARIGKALCLSLAGNGYDVALHYNSSRERAIETREEILAAGARCEVFGCDLSSIASARELVPRAMEDNKLTFQLRLQYLLCHHAHLLANKHDAVRYYPIVLI